MKRLLLIFAGFMVLSACENTTEEFASITADVLEEKLPSEIPQYHEDLQSIVKEEARVKKIGAKKRQHIDVTQTVGGKNLGKKKRRLVTNVKITNIIVSDKDESAQSADESPSESAQAEGQEKAQRVNSGNSRLPVATIYKEPEEEVVFVGKDMNILFYMKDRSSRCVQEFRRNYKSHGFLSPVGEIVDWHVGFSKYSEGEEMPLIPMGVNGTVHNLGGVFSPEYDYVLSKGEYKTRRNFAFFMNALNEENKSYSARDSNIHRTVTHVEDPLAGLDHILSEEAEAFSKDSETLVVLLDYDFPYYSSKRWGRFFKKHRGVHLLAVADRSANVSNLMHILENNYRLTYSAVCSPESVLSAVKELE